MYGLGVDGYIFVFGINSQISFNTVKTINEKVLNLWGTSSVPVVLVGNKADLDQYRCVFVGGCRFHACASGEGEGLMAVVGLLASCVDKSLHRRLRHSRPSGAVRLLSARPRRATISVRHLLMVRARALFAGLTIVCMCLYVCVCGVDVIFDKLLEQIEKSGRAPPAPSKSGDCSLL